jgi:hypothetical protein
MGVGFLLIHKCVRVELSDEFSVELSLTARAKAVTPTSPT